MTGTAALIKEYTGKDLTYDDLASAYVGNLLHDALENVDHLLDLSSKMAIEVGYTDETSSILERLKTDSPLMVEKVDPAALILDVEGWIQKKSSGTIHAVDRFSGKIAWTMCGYAIAPKDGRFFDTIEVMDHVCGRCERILEGR